MKPIIYFWQHEKRSHKNTLYLGEKKVLLPAGYPKTEEKLRREGFKPVLVNVSEFWKGDGGVTCLNLPFYKPL